MIRPLLFVLVISFISCKESPKEISYLPEDEITSNVFSEKFRPQFHFSPPEKWMNDPNGLVYFQETYHLFYQYYPEDIVWGPMHWGHAVSPDLVHWEHKPIALYPDELGYIFSGSAVADLDNTSGFGTDENPPLVAIYTYHLMEGEKAGRKDYQTQGIAFSLDNGDTWTKYQGNPVIGNKDIKDFRDPKVFWHDDTAQWILALVAGDHALFYSSSNLKEWKLLSEFGKDMGAHGGVWECPDLFKLKVTGSDEEKYILFISINPGAPNGGSGTQYFVGDFDGTAFTTSQTNDKWIDMGRDNYAGVTYNNMPNNERVFIGWMSNWDYAQKTPTEAWRSAMTLPRDVSLHKDDKGYFLKNYPIAGIATISSELEKFDLASLKEPFFLKNDTLNGTDLAFEANLSKKLKITFQNEASEKITLEIDPETKELLLDRTQSGLTNFEERFAGEVQKQSYHPNDEWVEIRMILDASSLEVFIDKGRYVFTNQVFPEQPYTNIEISGEADANLRQLKLNKLTSIWKNHD